MKNKLTGEGKYVLIGTGFIVGYIFAPCLEAVSGLIQSKINSVIGRMQMKLEEDQGEHQAAMELITPSSEGPTSVVGFQVPDEPEYEGDDYE